MGKNNNNYWVKSGFFAISQRISIPLFGVGTFLIIIRSLTKEEMGVWALFMSITTAIEVGRNGLIKAAMVKFFTEAVDEHKKEVLSSAFYINLIYTTIVQVLLVVSSGYLSGFFESDQLGQMILYYSISAVLFIPFSHLEYVQQANLNFKGIFISYFVKQGWFFATICFLILILDQNISLIQLVLFQAISVFLGAVSSYITSRKYLVYNLRLSSEWISKLFSFGKYGLYTNLSNSALTTSDHILIGGLLSSTSVAIHNVAARITNVFVIPSVAVADILYPKTVRANEDDGVNAVKSLYEKAVAATLVPMIPVIIVVQLVPEFIIYLLAGSDYIEATPILRVTILGIIILPFLKQFGTVMNTLNKPHYNFYFVLCIALLNIGLNYQLISMFGILGGAIATLISYVIGFVSCQLILQKVGGISTSAVFKYTINYYTQMFKWTLTKIAKK
ncbi:flippase [Reichenbachiella ulvae]|uniref:Flippase n=1 Tax=Reichenbachiella ulvae TaxID=2980104 RepID=A0ABT3D1Z7_9BACT|nr:flippase [Reichenbachiella ulvae]MCV9389473.1 flippase [Reichenbachiella ulvae]